MSHLFRSRKTTLLVAAFVSLALLTPAPFAEAKDSAFGRCATWFGNLRERIFIHYNYRATGNGLTAISPADYNNAWLRVTRSDFRRNAKYLERAIAEGHPQVGFLEKLGFKFGPKNGHYIPSMSEVSSSFDKIVGDLLASGKTTENDVIRPARMFQVIENGERRLIPVGLTSAPPAGATPVADTIRGEEFYRFIAEGYWPIGEIMPGADTNISFALHDIGHMGAMLRNPEFMASVRNFARIRVKENRFDIPSRMINLIFEGLAVGRAEAHPEFLEDLAKLGIKRKDFVEPWTARTFEQELLNVSDSEISKAVAAAYAKRHAMIDELGGARSDITSSGLARDRVFNSSESFLENPKAILESAYDAVDPRVKRIAFMRYLSAMDHTTRIKAADWLGELTHADQLAEKSKIYKYLCKADIYSYKSNFYRTFCRLSGP